MQSGCAILSYMACRILQYYCALSLNSTIFDQTLLKIKCVLIFSTYLVSNILIQRAERGMNYCQILMKLEISGQIFQKYSKIGCIQKLSIGSRVVPCGRTEGQTGRSLIVALRNFANVSKKKHIRSFAYKSYIFEHTDCKRLNYRINAGLQIGDQNETINLNMKITLIFATHSAV
jgi:hypothetical protein